MKSILFIAVLGIIYYLTKRIEHIEDQTSLKIAGLGKFNQQDLLFVAKVMEDFANIKSEIVEPISTTDKTVYRYMNKQLKLDCKAMHKELPFNSFTKRLMLVTSEELSNGDEKIGGLACNFDKVAFVSAAMSRPNLKLTIIHEYCHLLKLNHCENKSCIMNESPFVNNAVDLCETCKRKIHFTKTHI
jgi:predicted Zn-dependent protease